MNGAQLSQYQEMCRLERTLQSAQEQLQAADLEHQSDLGHKQASANKHTVLRNKTKQQLLKQRQIPRELGARTHDISQLQTLVGRLAR